MTLSCTQNVLYTEIIVVFSFIIQFAILNEVYLLIRSSKLINSLMTLSCTQNVLYTEIIVVFSFIIQFAILNEVNLLIRSLELINEQNRPKCNA